MTKKKSMGHNPLAYSLKGDASFDFIRSTENQESTPDKEKNTPQKKVASYYLEEDIINTIRALAKEKNDSYSHIANDLLKYALEQKNKESEEE
jgi:hypothetical protein